MDYKNGKIYRVVCSETDRQYIGSTCSTLVKRLSNHKRKKDCMCKDFITPKIFLIEDYPCDRKEQLLMRERFYMESMECVNLKRPIVTKDEQLKHNREYYQENKEQIRQQKKDYYKNNKEQLSKKGKLNFDCECGGKYQHSDKAKHKKTKKHQAYISSIV